MMKKSNQKNRVSVTFTMLRSYIVCVALFCFFIPNALYASHDAKDSTAVQISSTGAQIYLTDDAVTYNLTNNKDLDIVYINSSSIKKKATLSIKHAPQKVTKKTTKKAFIKPKYYVRNNIVSGASEDSFSKKIRSFSIGAISGGSGQTFFSKTEQRYIVLLFLNQDNDALPDTMTVLQPYSSFGSNYNVRPPPALLCKSHIFLI